MGRLPKLRKYLWIAEGILGKHDPELPHLYQEAHKATYRSSLMTSVFWSTGLQHISYSAYSQHKMFSLQLHTPRWQINIKIIYRQICLSLSLNRLVPTCTLPWSLILRNKMYWLLLLVPRFGPLIKDKAKSYLQLNQKSLRLSCAKLLLQF